MSDREDFEVYAKEVGLNLVGDEHSQGELYRHSETRAALAAFLAGRKPPKGWKLVPVRETGLMRIRGRETGARNPGFTWEAMLAAAPERE